MFEGEMKGRGDNFSMFVAFFILLLTAKNIKKLNLCENVVKYFLKAFFMFIKKGHYQMFC